MHLYDQCKDDAEGLALLFAGKNVIKTTNAIGTSFAKEEGQRPHGRSSSVSFGQKGGNRKVGEGSQLKDDARGGLS